MARKTKAAPVADDEIEELDDVEEVEELEDDEASDEGDGLTAKALAKELGTNGREVRKFLRHKYGKVGQGARWNINPDLVDELKKDFADWGKRTRSTTKKSKATPTADDAVDEVEELENDELEDISDIEELDDLELDD
jgi:hypothetical protein